MTAIIYLVSLVWESIGNGCYPRVTSSSAVSTSPRWPRPPVATSAPTAPPWALASLTGIGVLLIVIAGITSPRGMVQNISYHVYISYIISCIISCMYIISLVLSRCITPAAMPQPYCDLYHYHYSVSQLWISSTAPNLGTYPIGCDLYAHLFLVYVYVI